MRLPIKEFYRKFVVRKDNTLAIPNTYPLSQFEPPFNYITHWFPDDTTSFGPSLQDPLLSASPNVYINHIEAYSTLEGNPRYRPANMAKLLLGYRRTHRDYKKITRWDMVTRNRKNILLVNYAPMDHAYIYRDSYKQTLWRFRNHVETLVDQINDTAKQFPDWNQFVHIYLPDDLPTRQDLVKTNVAEMTRLHLEVFNTCDKLLFRELWRWPVPEEDTAFDRLTEEAFNSLYFIVHNGERFSVLHAGTLRSWSTEVKDGHVAPDQLQRRLLAFCLRVRYSTQAEDVTPTKENTSLKETDNLTQKTPTRKPKGDISDGDLDDLSSLFKRDTKVKSVAPKLGQAPKLEDTPYFDETVTEDDKTEAHDDVLEEDTYNPNTSEIIKRANALRDARRITKATYNKIITEAEGYKTKPDPYGFGTTLEKLADVTKEDLSLPNTQIAKDRKSVVDKSMLYSSMSTIRKKYVKEVLRKDLTAAVLSIQKRGTIVKDYKVEMIEDAMSRYEIHKITLQPVGGRPVTLPVRIPTPDENGKLKVNDKLYAIRDQRVDIPIRKVKPDRVALTSYLRKLFVERTPAKAYSVGQYMARRLTERANDPEDKRVISYVLRNVFKAKFKLPLQYTEIAERISDLTFMWGETEVTFNFDYANQSHHFKEEEIKLRSEGAALLGKFKGKLVQIDQDNMVSYREKNEWVPVDTLMGLLDLYQEKTPVQYAEMKVSDKTLPMGFILAYIFGIEALVKALGTKVERYPRNQRIAVDKEQYRLVFDDEQWLLDRSDIKSSLIFSGLNQFKNTLKRHTVHEFNSKDAYFLLLNDAGLNTRYLVEIDDLVLSWMDPTTEGLLKDMGEPTNFPELLIRAVDLLTHRQSPEEMDISYMRLRGHERFAGMLYKQLHLALISRDRRDSNGDTRVELNPFEVWQKILDDPTILSVREANPIQNVREQEGITYRGEGGRSDQTMKAQSRKFLPSNMGVDSESTPDSGAVGIVAYTSPDANIVDLRGRSRAYNPETDGNTKLFSSSLLLSPSADQDDQ